MVKSQLKYQGVTIKVYAEEVTLPNGNTVVLDIVRHPGAAAIVPVLADGRFVLIRQYRYAAGGYIYEIPAGKLDVPGEDPLACAKRELKEETGFSAKAWKKLISIKTTPGFCDEVIHIYLAQDLFGGATAHEDSEVIEIMTFTRAEVEKMLATGQITDGKSLVGLYAALQRL